MIMTNKSGQIYNRQDINYLNINIAEIFYGANLSQKCINPIRIKK